VTEIWQTNQYIIAKLTMFLLLDIVFKLRYADVLVEKISILLHRRDWNFLWGGVSFKTKKIKEMYEASFKCFQRGGGEGGGVGLSLQRYGDFLQLHNAGTKTVLFQKYIFTMTNVTSY